MAYPWRYIPVYDFAAAAARGETFDPRKLALELANIAETTNQIRTFIRAGFAADTRWKPLEAVAQEIVEELRYSATAGQTEFEFPSGTTAVVATDTARVFSGGTLIDPSLVTLDTDKVTIPAQTAGTVVVVYLTNGAAGLRADLASTAAGMGASLSGIEDALGLFTADDVEGALAESAGDIATLTASLAAISDAILADGTVTFAADQSMGGYHLTNLPDGTETHHPATVAQLNDLTSVLGNLSNSFLALSGGVMAGDINMSLFSIRNLADPDNPQDAVNKQYTDGIADQRLHLTGTKKSITEGSLTGPVSMGTTTDADADTDQTGGGAPADVNVPTFYGVPNPTDSDHVVNKRTLDSEIARLSALLESTEGTVFGSCNLSGAITSITDGGVYHATAVQIGSATTLGDDTWVYSSGNVTVTGAITGATYDLYIESDGDVSISAALSVNNLTINANGNISYSANLTAAGDVTLRSTAGNITAGSSAAVTVGSGKTASFTANAGSVSFADSADVTASGGGTIVVDSSGDVSIINCDFRARGTGGADEAIASGGEDPPAGGNGPHGGGLGGDRTTSDYLLAGAARPELRPLVGGQDGQDGYYGGSVGTGGAKGTGGGVIRVTCRGDGDLTGSTFLVDGGAGGDGSSSGSSHPGSGAGAGSVRITIFGTHTGGGTLYARGGVSGANDDPGTGGGGGLAVVLAPAPAGTTVTTATGGAGSEGGDAGGPGTATTRTLTAAQLQCLDTRGAWDS